MLPVSVGGIWEGLELTLFARRVENLGHRMCSAALRGFTYSLILWEEVAAKEEQRQAVARAWTRLKRESAQIVPIMHRSQQLSVDCVGYGEICFFASERPQPMHHHEFWQMVMQLPLTAQIVDLTDGAQTPYYPTTIGEEKPLGDGSLRVVLQKVKESSTGRLVQSRYVILEHQTSQKVVRRLHFKAWPDGGVISVQWLGILVDRLQKNAWVHCQAGMGRTGTLITAKIIKEQIAEGRIATQDELLQRLVEIILVLRQQRGRHIVYAKQQFRLLCQFGKEALRAAAE